jgi:hypothetical protein
LVDLNSLALVNRYIVKDVTYVSDYKLLLSFDDGSERLVDLANELDGEIFEPLKDLLRRRGEEPEREHVRFPQGKGLKAGKKGRLMRRVNWEGEPASRFPLPTLATKIRGSLLPFTTDLLIGAGPLSSGSG